MCNFARKVVESGIRMEQPDISDIDLLIAVFKRYYEHEFSAEEVVNICNHLRAYHERKQQLKNENV